eukprot:TRINITY_DN58999_c0_g1_i1.p1 TRINITY_DN58999_c0_g1~~TRINITY_DN58999_c0_g1_i1.p1  ORF type:complete len:1755 (+),score=344.71 TRINITY_DN58999_c0_g1_i1:91-5355(+)
MLPPKFFMPSVGSCLCLCLGLVQQAAALQEIQEIQVGSTFADVVAGLVKPVRVGAVVTLDIDRPTKHGAFGEDVSNAYRLFVKFINNERGGIRINGTRHPLVLHLFDDRSEPEHAEELARHLIYKKKIRLLLGPATSNLSQAVGSVVNDSGAVMLAPALQSSAVLRNLAPGTFSLLPAASSFLEPALQLLQSVGAQSIVAIREDSGIGHEACDVLPGLVGDLGLSLEGTYSVPAEASAEDLKALLEALKAQWTTVKIEVLVACLHADRAGSLLKQMQSVAFDSKALVLTSGAHDPQFVEHAGHLAQYVIGVRPGEIQSNLNSSLTGLSPTDFGVLYKMAYGKAPTYYSYAAFAAGEALVSALEEANSTDPPEVAAALRGLHRWTVQGELQFDEQGQNNISVDVLQYQSAAVATLLTSAVDVVYPRPTSRQMQCLATDAPAGRWGIRFEGAAVGKDSVTDVRGMEATYLWTPAGIAMWQRSGLAEAAARVGVWQAFEFVHKPQVALLKAAGWTISQLREDGHIKWTRSRYSVEGIALVLQLFSNTGWDRRADWALPAPGELVTSGYAMLAAAWDIAYGDSIRNGLLYQDPEPFTSCLECPEGLASYYEADLGVRLCLSCSKGTSLVEVHGSRFCEACQAGRFRLPNESAVGGCPSCPRGRYQNETGQSLCHACPRGKFSDAVGMLTCDSCRGMEGLFASDEGQGFCTSSPEGGMVVEENGLSVAVTNKDGYFMVSNEPMQIIRCAHAGGRVCLSHGRCHAAMEGPVCGVCRKGHGRRWFLDICEECPSPAAVVVKMLVGATFFFTCILAMCLLAFFTDFTAENSVRLVIMKQVLNYMQMTTVVFQVVDIDFPFGPLTYLASLHGLSAIRYGHLASECALHMLAPNVAFWQGLLFVALLFAPVWLAGWAVVFGAVQAVRRYCLKTDKPNLLSYLIMFCIVTLFVVQPVVAEASLLVLSCKLFDKWRMLADTEVVCYDDYHTKWMVLGLSWFVLLPVAVPCFFLAILVHFKQRAQKVGQFWDPETVQRLGFLYSGFAPHAYFYEPINMLRKALVQLIVSYNTYSERAAIELLIVVSVFFLVQIRAQPYDNRGRGILNRIELASLAAVFTTVQLQCWFSACRHALLLEGEGTQRGLQILLGLVILYMHGRVFFLAAWGFGLRRLAKAYCMPDREYAQVEIHERGLKINAMRGSSRLLTRIFFRDLARIHVASGYISYKTLVASLQRIFVRAQFLRLEEQMRFGSIHRCVAKFPLPAKMRACLVKRAQNLEAALYRGVNDAIAVSKTKSQAEALTIKHLESLRTFTKVNVERCTGQTFSVQEIYSAMVNLGYNVCSSERPGGSSPTKALLEKKLEATKNENEGRREELCQELQKRKPAEGTQSRALPNIATRLTEMWRLPEERPDVQRSPGSPFDASAPTRASGASGQSQFANALESAKRRSHAVDRLPRLGLENLQQGDDASASIGRPMPPEVGIRSGPDDAWAAVEVVQAVLDGTACNYYVHGFPETPKPSPRSSAFSTPGPSPRAQTDTADTPSPRARTDTADTVDSAIQAQRAVGRRVQFPVVPPLRLHEAAKAASVEAEAEVQLGSEILHPTGVQLTLIKVGSAESMEETSRETTAQQTQQGDLDSLFAKTLRQQQEIVVEGPQKALGPELLLGTALRSKREQQNAQYLLDSATHKVSASPSPQAWVSPHDGDSMPEDFSPIPEPRVPWQRGDMTAPRNHQQRPIGGSPAEVVVQLDVDDYVLSEQVSIQEAWR